MKPVFLPVGVLLVALFPFNASAADCRTIVANTLAELKAAYPEWDDSMETLVRTAAGSACVKASSAAPAATTTQIQERAVRSGGEVVEMESAPASTPVTSTAVAASSSAVGGASESSASTDDTKDKEEDSGWNPFKDIKFNKVSASPNKKPYERRRDVNKAAPASDEDESE